MADLNFDFFKKLHFVGENLNYHGQVYELFFIELLVFENPYLDTEHHYVGPIFRKKINFFFPY